MSRVTDLICSVTDLSSRAVAGARPLRHAPSAARLVRYVSNSGPSKASTQIANATCARLPSPPRAGARAVGRLLTTSSPCVFEPHAHEASYASVRARVRVAYPALVSASHECGAGASRQSALASR